jgi:outer membrane receptor protein involved in Fe transport
MQRFVCSLIKLVAVLSILVVTPTLWAQGVTGSAVTGTVSEDATGTPVAGAFIEIKNTATGDTLTALAGADGTYFIDNVPPGGPYVLTVTAGAYKQARRSGIQLQLGQRLQFDQVMSLNEEEIVIVDRLDPLKDKGRTGPSTTVSRETIAKLPLQGRNFTDLLSTSPQANGNSIGGQNNRYNNIQIDGGANNDLFGLTNNGTPGGQSNAKPISIEAIKEFVIQVAPFDVRQSSFTGGLVNAITKSGTNEFHGDAFGYFQNKSLAGRRDDPTFLDYRTWQFGGDVGGPIIEDKVHFFAAVDLQSRNQSFGNAFQLNGNDEHDLAAAGFNTATVNRFRDILSSKYDVTNAGSGSSPKLSNPDRNVFAKVTTNQIPNSRLEVSYNLVDASQDNLTRAPTSPSLPTANAAGVVTGSGRLRDGYELSNSGFGQANTTNTARLKLASNWGDFSNELLAGVSIIRDARDLPNKLPLILVDVGKLGSSDSWLAAGGERFSHQNQLDQDVYEIQDNVTYSGLAGHHLTLGTSNELLRIRNVFFQAAYGAWEFSSLDAFDAGMPTAYQRRFAIEGQEDPGTAKFNVTQLGLYVQDEWSVLKNLTLTPGFRVDLPLLGPATRNPALVNNAAFPIDTRKVPTGNLLISPRLGVNWDVEGDASTIVRGGVGLFTGRPPYVWVSNAYVGNGLSQIELTCVGATGVPTFTVDPNNQPTDCKGGTSTLTPPKNQGEIDYFDSKTKYPQNFRTALGADHRLPWGLTATTDLMYSREVNGWYTTDANLATVGSDGDGRLLYGSFAPNPGKFTVTPARFDPMNLTSAVKVYNKNGARAYNATFALSKIFPEGIQIDTAYTYSNSADRISLTSFQAFSNFQFAPLDGSLGDRNVRPSAFDRRHKVTVTSTASLPYGFGAGLSFNMVSGLPYTWTVNGDVNGDGVNGNDLVFVPGNASQITLMDPSQYDALAAFINKQDCLKSAKGAFVERGACRNPWSEFLNLRGTWQSPAVIKGQRFELQLDIFNVLNLIHNKWGLLDQATSFENGPAFLRAVGYDVNAQRPIYTFAPPTNVVSTVYSPTASRWRIQLGARYTF